MRRFGIAGLLVGLLSLGVVGITAYQLGVTDGSTSAALEAGARVIYRHGGLGFGFPFVGLLFGLLFLGIVVSLSRRAAFHRGYGPGFGPGRGPWGGHGYGGRDAAGDRTVPPPFDAMLGRWHAEAHGRPAPGATERTGSTSAGPAGPTDPPTQG